MKSTSWALGTVQFGVPYGLSNNGDAPTLDTVFEILSFAIQNGIHHFDTARAYGLAEERLGLFLKEYRVQRQKFSISTKLQPLSSNSKQPYSDAKESLDVSLNFLGLEKIDTLMVHRWENWKNLDIRKALNQYKKHFGCFGVSVLNVEEFKEALLDLDIKYIQLPFNILDWRWRTPEIHKLIRKRSDITFQCRSVFLQGLLLKPQNSPIKDFDIRPIYQNLSDVKEKFNRKTFEDLCYAYVQSVPWVNSLVFGVDSLDQLQANLISLKQVPLRTEETALIEKLFTEKSVPENLLSPALWTEVKK